MPSNLSTSAVQSPATRRDRSGSLWVVQAFSGLFLVFILGMHMIAHHFVVEDGLRNYQQVLDYVANPAIFVTEILFVILATVHALLGVRSIIIDLRPSPAALRTIQWLLVVVGVVTIGYGLWLAFALRNLAV